MASRAEPITQSGRFANGLGIYVAVNRRVGRLLGRATGGLLHLVNIPTATDIGKLHQHLASVDVHIAELIGDLDHRDPGEAEPGQPPADPEKEQQRSSTPPSGTKSSTTKAQAKPSTTRSGAEARTTKKRQ